MKLDVDAEKLRFLILPTRFYPPEFHQDHVLAYRTWKNIWGHAFAEEMGGLKGSMKSDSFSRHSHVAILFYEEKLACMANLNYLDLTDEVAMDDSYFEVWPDPAKMKIRKEAAKIIACCNLALEFHFRQSAYGIRWKDLMFAILVKHLQATPYDSMVATVRLEKGMERSAYRTGATALAKDLPYTIPGQSIDIVNWSRGINLQNFDPVILFLIEHIWKKSFQYIDYSYQISNEGEKNAA